MAARLRTLPALAATVALLLQLGATVTCAQGACTTSPPADVWTAACCCDGDCQTLQGGSADAILPVDVAAQEAPTAAGAVRLPLAAPAPGGSSVVVAHVSATTAPPPPTYLLHQSFRL